MGDTRNTDESDRAEYARIRSVYRGRDAEGKKRLYAWHKADVLFSRYRLLDVIARELIRLGWEDLSDVDCLDVGCGSGWWLRTLLEWGVDPSRLHGVELLSDRVAEARAKSPHLDLRRTEGMSLPFPDASMDLVSAFTVLSSILDPDVRKHLGDEMLRAVRPNGVILIHDFRISHPANRNTTRIGRRELHRVFPGVRFRSVSLMLAPPLQRRLLPFSPAIGHLAEALLPWMRTHVCHVGRVV